MKFPMRERPFTRMALSTTQCAEYEALLANIINATLDERERFIHLDNGKLSRKLWKAVKNREDVTVCKRLGRDLLAPPERSERQQPAEGCPWSMPKLIIAGNLDDVMYGIVTPDAPTIAVKTSYVNDELVDSAVLHEISGATREDPFQFTGLKWMVKAHAASISAVVWPRDFVFVESTGVRTFRNGARVGFHAMHSVQLPQCCELESLGILRGRFSACYLYNQRSPGTVEVYSMAYVEPGGNPPETIAVMSAANTMIGMWKAVWCSHNKKLSWLLENDDARRRFRAATREAAGAASDNRCCLVCSKAFGSFRKSRGCMLCAGWVCSRCRVARSISAANEALELTTCVVKVCKSCIANVSVADAFVIARDQYVASYVEPLASGAQVAAAKPKSLQRGSDDRPREYSTDSSATQSSSLASLGNFEHMRSWSDAEDIELQGRARVTSECDSVVMETIEDSEEHQHGASSTANVPFRPALTRSESNCSATSETNFCAATNATVPLTLTRSTTTGSSTPGTDFSPAANASFRPALTRRVTTGSATPNSDSCSARSRSASTSSSASETDERIHHHQVLLRRMHSLCIAAEQTYQITSLNASRVHDARTARDI